MSGAKVLDIALGEQRSTFRVVTWDGHEVAVTRDEASAERIVAAFEACASAALELDTLSSCGCDHPPPGESGVIECHPCRDRRLAKMLRAAVTSGDGK